MLEYRVPAHSQILNIIYFQVVESPVETFATAAHRDDAQLTRCGHLFSSSSGKSNRINIDSTHVYKFIAAEQESVYRADRKKKKRNGIYYNKREKKKEE